MERIFKPITPPIVWRASQKFVESMRDPSSMLFKGDYSLYKSVLNEAKLYGEYGCGASTEWVLAHTDANILAVDASLEWIESVKGGLDQSALARIELHHVDLGQLGEWGRPINYEKRKDFTRYTDWMWERGEKPDTVLVDGRFRVCSFLTALKFAAEGTKIIFDDYINRPYYHVVEEFLPREAVCGRQCLFIVPASDKLDYDQLEMEIQNFRHVMD